MARPRFLFEYKPFDINERSAGPVCWRLLGANNRELGRGPGQFSDLEGCQAAVRDLVARIAGATPGITSDSGHTGAWSWRLDLGGRAVAVSCRTYLRHRECTYSLAHFIGAVPEAVVATALSAGGRR
ncbi:MAG TPA: hypothetical protein VGZ32_25690 [Actinocrinis sp.]|jgi:hypothetical protein|uniref:hypothetical protein n=1 Tax=Actinocrinis sp. TaxID=1920516 RepID=UPI002DDCAFE1|nr:hypothetical protein [Actinocrinis sp.]HEV3173769.1 hypothetical protein [Actinocrinis sp.]